jgi:hypothetical protein
MSQSMSRILIVYVTANGLTVPVPVCYSLKVVCLELLKWAGLGWALPTGTESIRLDRIDYDSAVKPSAWVLIC